MPEKRTEPRFLCSDLVLLRWSEGDLRGREETVVLENISASGACVQAEVPVIENSGVTLLCGSAEFHGYVRSCYLRDAGYFIGIAFDADSKWSKAKFQPEHLLDPRTVRPRKLAGKMMMFAGVGEACLAVTLSWLVGAGRPSPRRYASSSIPPRPTLLSPLWPCCCGS